MKFLDGFVYFTDAESGLAVGFHQKFWRLFHIVKTEDKTDFIYTPVAVLPDEKAKDKLVNVLASLLDTAEEYDVIAEGTPTLH